LSLLSSGCGPSGFVEPIGKFQSAANVVIASTKLYVTELNKVERDNYIVKQLSARKRIEPQDLEDVQVFTQDGLKARLDALDQLGKYGDLLSKLAKSDVPEKVRAEADDLGGAIIKLDNTVQGLNKAQDSDFKAAVKPVTSIIGEILKSVVDRKIETALNKAVAKGEQPINELIRVIRIDVDNAYERRRVALSAVKFAAIEEYNTEMARAGGPDVDRLRFLAERIRENEDRWETFATSNPGEGLDAMAKAHTALVEYAKSAHKVKDLASLVSAMEAFATKAVSIGKSVQALREI
jgi:hypothetical protein